MFRILTAQTRSAQLGTLAITEIMEQLDLANNLLDRTIGIVACNSAYISENIVAELRRALPFEIVGFTTTSSATNDSFGSDLLSIAILTSDDSYFSAAATAPLTPENLTAEIAKTYREARAKLGGAPSLSLAYAASISEMGGSAISDAIFDLADRVPVFGAFCCDETLDMRYSSVFLGEKSYSRSVVLVLIRGAAQPKFSVVSLPNIHLIKDAATIDDAEGCVVKRVGGKIFSDYLDSLGFAASASNYRLLSPFVIGFGGDTIGAPYALFSITKEGYGVLGGEARSGDTLAIGALDYDGVIKTSDKLAREARDMARNGALIYSCLSRNLLLGDRNDDEMRQFHKRIGQSIKYHLGYTSGEICPVVSYSGAMLNRFHNYSLIACLF